MPTKKPVEPVPEVPPLSQVPAKQKRKYKRNRRKETIVVNSIGATIALGIAAASASLPSLLPVLDPRLAAIAAGVLAGLTVIINWGKDRPGQVPSASAQEE